MTVYRNFTGLYIFLPYTCLYFSIFFCEYILPLIIGKRNVKQRTVPPSPEASVSVVKVTASCNPSYFRKDTTQWKCLKEGDWQGGKDFNNKPPEERLNEWDVHLEKDDLTTCLGTSVVQKTDCTCSTRLQRSEPRPADQSHKERRGGGRL